MHALSNRWPLFLFLEVDFMYNYLHIVQKWTKNQRGTSNPAILRLQGKWNYGR